MGTYNPNSVHDRQQLAEELQALMDRSKFFKTITDEATEDVYEFPVRQLPGARIVVYSSIVGGTARGNGADAIRVVILYRRRDGKDMPLLSETRVNRTGSVQKIVDRVHERMQKAYVELRDRDRNGFRCDRCGAPKFTSRAGNHVCAETCWVK